MTALKIATWNVNSIRTRLPHLLSWLSNTKPDVIALQETKVTDDLFPHSELEAAGYIAITSGQKSYNGVALLWKEKALDIVTSLPGFDDPQRRILGVTVDDIRIVNIYIPNGQTVGSEKFQYKLNWLHYLDIYLKEELKKYSKLIVLGDFNIAPDEIDVHNVKRWQGKIMFSDQERNAFRSMLQLGLHDSFRTLNAEERQFTWWDYRLMAYERNWGLRIDHILTSDALMPHALQCKVDLVPRTWERPSDHTPVLLEFKF